MEKQPCVYLLASKRNGTLYTGITSNLLKRVWEYKNNLVEKFTSKYHCCPVNITVTLDKVLIL